MIFLQAVLYSVLDTDLLKYISAIPHKRLSSQDSLFSISQIDTEITPAHETY